MSPSILWQQTVDPRGLAGTSEVAEFSPDARYIAAGAGDGKLRFYTSSGRELWVAQYSSPTGGKTGEIESLAFSPDGQYIAAGGNSSGVKIYRATDGQLVRSLSGSDVDGMAWSPNGQLLAFANGTSVNVYNTSNWSRRYTYSSGGSTNSIEFTQDSQYLISAGSSRRVFINRTSDGVQIRSFTAANSGGSVKSVRLSPDGTMVATANGNDTSFSVFRLNGTLVTRVDVPDSIGIVEAVAWSPDGKWLVVGGGGSDGTQSNSTLRTYRTSDWRLVQTVQGHAQGIEYIDFAPDGTILTSSEDGSIIRWTSPTGDSATPLPSPTPTPAPAPAPAPTPTPPTPINGTGNGLYGEYFNNMDFTNAAVKRTDATVNFNWGTSSPDSSVGSDTFSVRWTGQIQPRFSEEYTFYASTDDGVRLWVNGQQVINNWVNQAVKTTSGKIQLTAGQRYDIRLEYFENTGNAVSKLEWSSASQPREVIPQSQLYSGAASVQALNLGSPTPSPTPTGTPQTVTVEAENITQLSGFRREAVSVASGGNVISFVSGASNEQGTATVDFTGMQGRYNIVVGYFDETDGVASASVSVEGQTVSSWQFSQSLGSSATSSGNLTSHTIANVALAPGDTIQLRGIEHNGEHVRIDKLTFVPV
ncbi:PD40 domain-containing protein [Oscillatoria sp. FACHB-1407]|uniref:PA14 domain-containing protein n=1 Tax=Oscillatoria sp. FACHB-1407 TaxID=2692847 RepID=UPI00168852BC|nr:PA14 domain-containing protein [Oscillatoria sp. FACHB-1407]MBD2462568.1 PD40 domain-containing protein [Oscillatoria sp. FACHB-1407]